MLHVWGGLLVRSECMLTPCTGWECCVVMCWPTPWCRIDLMYVGCCALMHLCPYIASMQTHINMAGGVMLLESCVVPLCTLVPWRHAVVGWIYLHWCREGVAECCGNCEEEWSQGLHAMLLQSFAVDCRGSARGYQEGPGFAGSEHTCCEGEE